MSDPTNLHILSMEYANQMAQNTADAAVVEAFKALAERAENNPGRAVLAEDLYAVARDIASRAVTRIAAQIKTPLTNVSNHDKGK